MLYPLTIVCTALVLASHFSIYVVQRPDSRATIMSFQVPHKIKANQLFPVYAGFDSLSETYTIDILRCQYEICEVISRTNLKEEEEWWGRIAWIKLQPGTHQFELIVYRPWIAGGSRAVHRHSWQVIAD